MQGGGLGVTKHLSDINEGKGAKKRKSKSTQKLVSQKKVKKSAVKSKESTDQSDHIICP